MEKSRIKLNIVDIIVLIMALIVAAYAIYAFAVRMEDSGGKADIRYVIEIGQMRSGMAHRLAEGDLVYNGDGELMGTVVSVSVSSAYHEGSDSDGNVVYSQIDGYEVAYITIQASSTVKKAGYQVNGEYIAAGQSYALRSPKLYFEGECINVKAVKDQ